MDNGGRFTMNGDLTIKSGFLTAQGGKATDADGGFSCGIWFAQNASLSITGGRLTAGGGESLNTLDPDNAKLSFSTGSDTYNGDITVSCSGRLIAENVPSMAGGVLSFGLNMSMSELTVKDNAFVSVAAGNAINISDGSLKLSGGIVGSGYTNAEGSDTYIQKDSSIPVKFVIYPADYSKVDAALARAKALNREDYGDFTAVQAAMDAVVRGRNITEQGAVDAMAKAIEDAVACFEEKPEEPEPEDEPEPGEEPPLTGDNSNPVLWLTLLLISGGAVIGTTVVSKRKKYNS